VRTVVAPAPGQPRDLLVASNIQTDSFQIKKLMNSRMESHVIVVAYTFKFVCYLHSGVNSDAFNKQHYHMNIKEKNFLLFFSFLFIVLLLPLYQ